MALRPQWDHRSRPYTEKMAEPAAKRPRVTPRNSEAAFEAAQPKATPYADLHKLAGVIKKPGTPAYRTPSLSSASASRLNIRTPAQAARTPRPNTVARPQTARRGQPTTPHAIRALQQRQRAATPGRNRRKSLVQRRETPRDILRELSKKLAPTSLPIEPSPQLSQRTPQPAIRVFEDVDEGPTSAPPRLSIAIDEDDDSWHVAAPRLSELPADDKENYTLHSIEGGRDKGLSRNSLDSIRASELFGKLHEVEEEGSVDGEEDDPTIALDEVTKRTLADGENTQEFRALIDASRRQSRPSELGVQSSPGTSVQDETFQFRFSEKPRHSIAPALFEGSSHLGLGGDDGNNGGTDDEDDNAPLPDIDMDDEDDAAQQAAIDSMIDEASAFLDSAFDITPDPALRRDSVTHDMLPDALVHASKLAPRTRRALKVSKHGIQYPSLPLPVIKRLATSFARTSGALSANGNLSKDTLLEIERASEWFFEQVSEDLGAYSMHAGRKQIREDDVVGVMRRQRVLDERNTVFSLAQRLLPRELVQEIKMPISTKAKKSLGRVKKRKRQTMEPIEEEDSTIVE